MKLTGKILVVDNDKQNLDNLDIMLTKLSFKVIRATDGDEALAMIAEHSPDLMLIENVLPSMTGFEVTQVLKKGKEFIEYRDLPIIIMSSVDDPMDKLIGLEMGIEDYIIKPFRFTEVLARIRNVIKHKELVRRLVNRERKLAVVESLTSNLIAFTKHIKFPLATMKSDLAELSQLEDLAALKAKLVDFVAKFNVEYDRTVALIGSLDDQMTDIENKKTRISQEELSADELDRKLLKRLDTAN
ncbi:MAG: response regulator [Spirochaetales bacterium]|nr:response regulator [Spirochaetales bacterium]MBR6199901.1 response regulator [Spirochaetales bacterium]